MNNKRSFPNEIFLKQYVEGLNKLDPKNRDLTLIISIYNIFYSGYVDMCYSYILDICENFFLKHNEDLIKIQNKNKHIIDQTNIGKIKCH